MAKLTPKDIGKRIRTARLARKLSQVELGRNCGVSQATIQKIEGGKHSVRLGGSRYIIRIWLYLGLPPHEIDPIFGSEEVKTQFRTGFTRQLQQSKSGSVSVATTLISKMFDVMRDAQQLAAPQREVLFHAVAVRFGFCELDDGSHGVAIQFQLPDQSYVQISTTFDNIDEAIADYQGILRGIRAQSSPSREEKADAQEAT